MFMKIVAVWIFQNYLSSIRETIFKYGFILPPINIMHNEDFSPCPKYIHSIDDDGQFN